MERASFPVYDGALNLEGLGPGTKDNPVTFVIFGITGDLAMRKLVPALHNLQRDGYLGDDFEIVGVARSDADPEALKTRLRKGVETYSRSGLDEAGFQKLESRFRYVRVDYDNPDGFRALESTLNANGGNGSDRIRLFYLAVPPTAFLPIVDGLGKRGLLTPTHHKEGARCRVVFEKPFGRDIQSARLLNDAARAYLDEDQIFRMDHYLGKETVQNLLVFRFANAIFEPLWNRRYISHVRITAFEKIGIEGRGKFYEETGIVRDVLQNHLLQIFALCAMEPPVSFASERIRDERAKVFKSLRPLDTTHAGDCISLGQYRGYHDERGVAAGSRTPTFASVRLFVENWRWEGVPFILSTGKSQSEKMTDIEIHYTPVPLCLFEDNDVCTRLEPNVLRFRIQPEEGISLRFGAKTLGQKQDVTPVNMHFDFNQGFAHITPKEAYEKLLLDCLMGQQTLFARWDEVEPMWQLVAPLLEGTEAGTIPVTTYEPGTQGPEVKPR